MLQEIYRPTWGGWCARALPPGYESVDAVHERFQHAVLYDTGVWQVVHRNSQAHRGRLFQLVVLRPRVGRGPLVGVVNVNFWHRGRFSDLLARVQDLLPASLPPMRLILGGDFNLQGPRRFHLATDTMRRPGVEGSDLRPVAASWVAPAPPRVASWTGEPDCRTAGSPRVSVGGKNKEPCQ